MFDKILEIKQRANQRLFVEVTHVYPSWDKSGNRLDDIIDERHYNPTPSSIRRLGVFTRGKMADTFITFVSYTTESTGMLTSYYRQA